MANRQRPLWGDQVMPDNTAIGEVAAKGFCSIVGTSMLRF